MRRDDRRLKRLHDLADKLGWMSPEEYEKGRSKHQKAVESVVSSLGRSPSGTKLAKALKSPKARPAGSLPVIERPKAVQKKRKT